MWATSSLSRFSARSGWLSKLFSVAVLFFITTTAYANDTCAVGTTCDEGKAFTICRSMLDSSIAYSIGQGYTGEVVSACVKEVNGSTKAYVCRVRMGWQSTCWNSAANYSGQSHFYYGDSCASRPHQFNWKHNPEYPTVCYNGCTYESHLEIDIGENPGPALRYHRSTGAACVPDPDAPPPEDCPLAGCFRLMRAR
jgi:hypothetical protein